MIKPPSAVVEFRNLHAQYLCDRMRPDEIAQYLALSGAREFDADEAARRFMTYGGVKFSLIGADGYPACCGGYYELVPGVWESWMLGSCDGWAKNWRSMTKGARWMMQTMFEHFGARRLQTHSLVERELASKWYEKALGMTREGVLLGFGANGEHVAVFARVRT